MVLLALCVAATASAAKADDPLQAQEWWLANIGATSSPAPGPGVPITIVDSGTDPTHEEFAQRPNTTFLDNQSVVGPGEYHGTIVASVAAAPANGVGIVGVYPNAALQLFDASADPRGISDELATAGIVAASTHCPGVISLSFGGTSPSPAIHAAILGAVHNGCLVVAAAGNDGTFGNDVKYPAAWPHVFTVGATDQSDQVADFSTRSPANDLAAPGVDITGAVPLGRDPTGYESSLGGTSFAAPMVAAAAAWIWTLRPTLTASQLAGILRSSARDIGPPGWDAAAGWGILNIAAALVAQPPANDPLEPNDDIDQVKPGRLFDVGEQALTSASKPSTRIAATLSAAEDPHDVYRIFVPARKTVRVGVAAAGNAAARIWGPLTERIGEGLKARRRDLKGPKITAGARGITAYVEVLLTGRSVDASYTLSVTASKR